MGPFVRYINLNPLIIIFCTSLLSVGILLIYLLATKQAGMLRVRTHLPWMMLSALLLFLNVYTYYLAYTTTTMANAVLTHYTAPIFAALLAPVILGERLKKITLISLVISMSGLVLIASSGIAIGRQHLAGILFGRASGHYVLSAFLSGRHSQATARSPPSESSPQLPGIGSTARTR